MDPRLSVVFPVFNERDNLPVLIEEIRQALDPLDLQWEMLAVDDGSVDGSAELLAEIARTEPRLRLLRLARNSGQTSALDAGWRSARGELVVSLDADLQNDPADIPRMMAYMDETASDMVVGVRINRRDTLMRRVQSRIGNGVRNFITGDHITDTGCSLKLVRRTWIDRVKLFTGMHRFLPTLVRIEGGRVVELGVNHRPRTWGRSNYGAANRAWKGFLDCIAVRWMIKRALRYQLIEEQQR